MHSTNILNETADRRIAVLARNEKKKGTFGGWRAAVLVTDVVARFRDYGA